MTRTRSVPLVLALWSLASCDTDGITSSARGLVVETTISDRAVSTNETATLTYRIRNASHAPRKADQNCGSGTFGYVEDAEGRVVYPGGGAWVCPAVVLPPITLGPGEEVAHTIQVAAGGSLEIRGSTLVLPPGRYTAYNVLVVRPTDHADTAQLRSVDVAFEVHK